MAKETLSKKLKKAVKRPSADELPKFVELPPTLENTRAVERSIRIGFAFNNVPHEGEEFWIYVLNFFNGDLTKRLVKTSEIQEIICLPGDGYVVRTIYCDYIIIVAHPYYKRPLEGLVYLAVAFYGKPIPHYGAYFRKIDFTHDGEIVGTKLVQTSPVKDVKFLTDDICVAHTEHNTYIVLLREPSLSRDSSTL